MCVVQVGNKCKQTDHVTHREVVDNCFRCVVVVAATDDVDNKLSGVAETLGGRYHVERYW